MKDSVTEILREHYKQKFNEFGARPEGVDWGIKYEDFILRFQKMINLIKYDDNAIQRPTLLDVGCGYGAMVDFISQIGIDVNYSGLDVVEEMIHYARKKYPTKTFLNGNFLQIDNVQYDYIICNGILTQKLTSSISEMDVFAKQIIHKMYNICNRGIAFNIMSDKVNYMVDNLYYKNPIEMFAMCLSELSGKVMIDHSYKLYEYTIYVYKES